MSYLAIAYPRLSKEDFDWIQSYRRKNDPRYFGVVPPHFTLVFPVGDIEKTAFLDEIRTQAAGIGKFQFELRVATIVQDDSGTYWHEFLVPDQGYSDIVKLHDKLYSGALARHLRFDLTFIPHIGIGNSDESLVSKERVDALNGKGVEISGSVDTIDVVEYADGIVSTIETVSLA